MDRLMGKKDREKLEETRPSNQEGSKVMIKKKVDNLDGRNLFTQHPPPPIIFCDEDIEEDISERETKNKLFAFNPLSKRSCSSSSKKEFSNGQQSESSSSRNANE